MLDPTIIRRLAFIKYLFRIGIQQSSASEPFSGAALLTFHDAVELFLQLASEHLNAGAAQPSFMDYWPLLAAKLPQGTDIAQKESMRRLNKARVALKHHGTLPSKLDIDAFRTNTAAFFDDNVTLVFGTPFDRISLTDFVQPEVARQRMQAAEKYVSDRALDEALAEIAIAFKEMLADYEARKMAQFSRSPFFFGRDLSFQSSFFMGLRGQNETARIAEFVDRVGESLAQIRAAMKILALGLDYRKYSRFQLYVPYVNQTMDGKYHLQGKQSSQAVSVEDVQFCIDFVVEAAVHLRDFDYDAPSQARSI